MSLLAACKSRFPSAFAMVRSGYLHIGSLILTVFAVSRVTTALYYFLFDHSFWREQHSVTRGVISYRRQRDHSARRFLLRRNIHRLEKGLSMQPRRPCFALDYIQETVDTCNKYRHESRRVDNDPVVEWSMDVLAKYFDTVTSNPVVDRARECFDACSAAGESHGRVPMRYRDRDGASHGVGLGSLRQLSRARRSVRWFHDQPVPRELIDQALEVAVQAPSSCNRQPFSYRIFDDRVLVGMLAGLPRGTTGFAENIPCLVAVVGDLSSFSSHCDRHGIYIDAGLSVMGFLYALECMGLGSCILNWPDVESLERRMEQILGLQPHERVIMLIALGFPDPDGLIPYSAKTSLDTFSSYNFTGQAGDPGHS